MTIHSYSRRTAICARQRGAILVSALLMLLVLTVIGVSVMQITRMQERMAGNTRDLNLAFQGAEAALREAEQDLWDEAFDHSPASRPTACSPRGVMPVLEQPDAGLVGRAVAGIRRRRRPGNRRAGFEDPQFIYEELAFVGPLVVDDPGGRMFYQVTSRSTGATGVLPARRCRPPIRQARMISTPVQEPLQMNKPYPYSSKLATLAFMSAWSLLAIQSATTAPLNLRDVPIFLNEIGGAAEHAGGRPRSQALLRSLQRRLGPQWRRRGRRRLQTDHHLLRLLRLPDLLQLRDRPIHTRRRRQCATAIPAPAAGAATG